LWAQCSVFEAIGGEIAGTLVLKGGTTADPLTQGVELDRDEINITGLGTRIGTMVKLSCFYQEGFSVDSTRYFATYVAPICATTDTNAFMARRYKFNRLMYLILKR
jgi:hypothetical protein